jgi:hypothetical protein
MAWTAENPLPTASMGLAAAVCQAPASGSGQWVYAVGGTNNNLLAALCYPIEQKIAVVENYLSIAVSSLGDLPLRLGPVPRRSWPP